MTQTIYLDHAASTPLYPEVKKVMQQFLEIEGYGNPSSVHSFGQGARSVIDQARIDAAKIFECSLDEVLFTSGATEALYLAIVGTYLSQKRREKGEGRIFVSPLSHSCIWGALEFLDTHFGVQAEILPITKEGFLDLEKIDEAFLSEADMVVCEHGNSELGHIQPVAKLGKMIDRVEGPKPILIVDGAASVVCEKISLEYQKCDLLALSGEKFGGPAGSGILLKRKEVEIDPLFSGSQEFGYRSGTENVMGIHGLVEALKLKEKKRQEERLHLSQLHQFFRSEFEKRFPDYSITTPEKDFLPHIFHFQLPEEKAEVFVQRADLAGFCISAGSACSSGAVTGSRALQNIGLSIEQSQRGVRVSFGSSTTEELLVLFLAWI